MNGRVRNGGAWHEGHVLAGYTNEACATCRAEERRARPPKPPFPKCATPGCTNARSSELTAWCSYHPEGESEHLRYVRRARAGGTALAAPNAVIDSLLAAIARLEEVCRTARADTSAAARGLLNDFMKYLEAEHVPLGPHFDVENFLQLHEKGAPVMQSTEPKPLTVRPGVSYPVTLRITPGRDIEGNASYGHVMWSADAEIVDGISITTQGSTAVIALSALAALVNGRTEWPEGVLENALDG